MVQAREGDSRVASSRLSALSLVHDLCCSFESVQDREEHAAEALRVIQAVASGGLAVISSSSPLASVLMRDFSGRPDLWLHVRVDDADDLTP